MFVSSLAKDYHLLCPDPGQNCSPCIDAANGDLSPATDIEGFGRVDVANENGGTGAPSYVDMGAFGFH